MADDEMGGWGALDDWVQEARDQEQRPAEDEPRSGDWRNVLVLAEVRQGRVRPACLEVIGKARQLAESLGARVSAVLLGSSAEQYATVLGWAGADRIYVCDDDLFDRFDVDLYRVRLRKLIEDRRPELVLMVQSPQTDALAGMLAQDLGTGAVAGCHDLELDTAERLFVLHHRSYTGRVASRVTIPRSKPQIATVARRSQPLPAPDRSRSPAVTQILPEVSREDTRLQVEGDLTPIQEESGLEHARIVVLAGKGVANKKNLEKVQAIAAFLDGEYGGTKAACDLGFVERNRQVGRMGKKIRPELLIALGVGGTTELLEGIDRKRLRLFLAVDVDPEAPVFQSAHVAIVADLVAWADAFLEEAKREDEAVSYQVAPTP